MDNPDPPKKRYQSRIRWTCYMPGEHVGSGENRDGRTIQFVARRKRGHWTATAWRQDTDREATFARPTLNDVKHAAAEWLDTDAACRLALSKPRASYADD